MKKTVFAVTTLFMAISVQSEIVFEGTNSFSSFSGQPSSKQKLVSPDSEGPAILRKLDKKQIDYTPATFMNRSSIIDPEGMIIEAEGFHQIQMLPGAGSSGSIRACKGGNGFALGNNNDSQFDYKIKVRTPGIYTFSIDAATKKDITELRMYGLKEGEKPEGKAPLATWKGYNSGDYDTIIQKFGGLNKDTPHVVDVILEEPMTHLAFAMDQNFNMDCIRITGFKPLDDSSARFVPGKIPLILIATPALAIASVGLFFFARTRKTKTKRTTRR